MSIAGAGRCYLPLPSMPLPTFLTVAGLFVTSGAALIIACVFFGLHRRYWRPFLRHWTWSWLALAIYATCSALSRLVALNRPIDDPLHITLSVLAGISG
jgi:hypothetical protein